MEVSDVLNVLCCKFQFCSVSLYHNVLVTACTFVEKIWKEGFLLVLLAGQALTLLFRMMHTDVSVKNGAGNADTSTFPPQAWT